MRKLSAVTAVMALVLNVSSAVEAETVSLKAIRTEEHHWSPGISYIITNPYMGEFRSYEIQDDFGNRSVSVVASLFDVSPWRGRTFGPNTTVVLSFYVSSTFVGFITARDYMTPNLADPMYGSPYGLNETWSPGWHEVDVTGLVKYLVNDVTPTTWIGFYGTGNFNSADCKVGWLVIVPEPTSLAALTCGVGWLGMTIGRKRYLKEFIR